MKKKERKNCKYHIIPIKNQHCKHILLANIFIKYFNVFYKNV